MNSADDDAIAAFAAMAGGLILARAVSDERLSKRILEATAKRVIDAAGYEDPSVHPPRRSIPTKISRRTKTSRSAK